MRSFSVSSRWRLCAWKTCSRVPRLPGVERLPLRSGSLREATSRSMRRNPARYSAGVAAAANPGKAAFTTSCEREKRSRRGSSLYSSAAAFITARTRWHRRHSASRQ
jgi:hypothetical protein